MNRRKHKKSAIKNFITTNAVNISELLLMYVALGISVLKTVVNISVWDTLSKYLFFSSQSEFLVTSKSCLK